MKRELDSCLRRDGARRIPLLGGKTRAPECRGGSSLDGID